MGWNIRLLFIKLNDMVYVNGKCCVYTPYHIPREELTAQLVQLYGDKRVLRKVYCLCIVIMLIYCIYVEHVNKIFETYFEASPRKRFRGRILKQFPLLT